MSAPPYRGFAPPSGDVPPAYEIVGVRRAVPLDLTFLDERILGLQCHWIWDKESKTGRSRLCFAYEGDCPYCGKHQRIWVGFIGVLNNARRLRQILRLGVDSARILSKHAEAISGLRGVRLLVSAPGHDRVARLVCTQPDRPANLPLPQAHYIDHTVCLVLGCKSIPDFRYGTEELNAKVLAPEEGGGL